MPKIILFAIIKGINLVFSPQEPVAVALDFPAKSLDTQSVGTKQQLGLSDSFLPNRGAGNILAGFTALFGTYIHIFGTYTYIVISDLRIHLHFFVSV